MVMKFESTVTDVSSTDRMFCYLWSEIGTDECKFGERWVKGGLDAGKDCAYRIRESLGVRKDLFDEGSVVVRSIWDVSDYAKKIGKFFVHGKVDDSLREIIGFRKQGEVHSISADEMEVKVNKELSRLGQPLKKCGLSVWQYRAVCETKTAKDNGFMTVLADMCARAGKTLYIGAVLIETDVPVTVVASYVLTSFTSFMGDLSSFEQFKDVEMIDSKDDDYKSKVKIARSAGKKVLVFLSLCKGGLKKNKRAERIKFLFSLNEPVMLVIDEADYGAWKSGQCDPLVKHRRDGDFVILMTGTNADRAVGGWDVDEVIQVTYLEMLMEKKVSA